MAVPQYLDSYTEEYPGSPLPETGYVSPQVSAGARYGGDAGGRPRVLDRVILPPGNVKWRAGLSASRPLTFYKVGGTWFATGTVPPANATRVVGGGYQTPVTLTELNEMLADGVITQDQYNEAFN
jgi:hypothetical protein